MTLATIVQVSVLSFHILAVSRKCKTERLPAHEVSRRPFITEALVRCRVCLCGVLVEKVTMRPVFIKVLRVYPVNIILPWFSTLKFNQEDEQ
jgi:hypothetical protein